nr:hypothetical protein [Tanacetum cinerariifolium]
AHGDVGVRVWNELGEVQVYRIGPGEGRAIVPFWQEILFGGLLGRGLKDSASWVKGTGSHGVLGEANGTIQVDAGVRERSYGGDGKKAGNVVAG